MVDEKFGDSLKEKEKIRVLIATNCYALDPVCYASHLDVFKKLGEAKDIDIVFFAPWRKPIDQGRNEAAKMAMVYDCDILFFYDDDMFFADAKIPLKLIRCVRDNDKINILQALAYIRGYPYKPMVFYLREIENLKCMTAYEIPEELFELAEKANDNGLVKVDAVGCCATAMRVELFNTLPEPWFLTGQKNTEDIFFCAKAKHYLQDAGIYCDTSVEVGHLLDRPILTTYSRKFLIELHEKYQADQVWLPDATFTPRQKIVHEQFKFETRPNILENIKSLPLKEEIKNDNRA